MDSVVAHVAELEAHIRDRKPHLGNRHVGAIYEAHACTGVASILGHHRLPAIACCDNEATPAAKIAADEPTLEEHLLFSSLSAVADTCVPLRESPMTSEEAECAWRSSERGRSAA